MAKKTERTLSIMAQIQNLGPEEQNDLINAMRMLEVNAQDEQYFTNVTKAMQAAGWNPAKRAIAGVKAAMRNKMETTKGINSRKTARALRLFGMKKTADFMDRWLTSAPKKKFKEIKTPTTPTSATRTSKTSVESVLVIRKQLNYLTGRVDEIGSDVTDIKSLLMPKFMTAKGAKGTADEGNSQIAMYNPLAPQGAQFSRLSEKGVLQGKPGKNFKSSAEQKAALETAKLALKIQEKDKAKAELKKKYAYKDDVEETKKEDPLDQLKVHFDKRLDIIEKKLGDRGEGLFGMIGAALIGLWDKLKSFLLPVFDILGKLGSALSGVAKWAGRFGRFVMGGMWSLIKAIGSGLSRFLGMFGITIPGLVAGGAAVATTAAIGAAIDKGMKQNADKAIDGVLTDVTNNIKKSGFQYSQDQKYKMYKDAMDASMATEDAKKPGRSEYRKQQWLQSEGLSDEERGMARRYFYEKEGGSKGPTSRGRVRTAPPAQQTIPAEMADSDTVDTNYANVPVAPAVGETGSLTVKPAAPPAGMTAEQWDIYRNTLASIESGGDYKAVGGSGNHYDGRYQMGKDAKSDAARILGIPDPGHTPEAREAFRNNPEFQEKMFAAYTAANYNYLKNDPLFKSLPKNKQIEVLGYAHNQGHGGAKKWMRTGEVGSDAFGTKGTRYSEALANNLRSAPVQVMAQNVTPAPALPGTTTDSLSRQMFAFNSPSSSGVFGMPPTVVNSTQINNTTVGKRPAAKADVLTQDNSFMRIVGRDAVHPVTG